MLYIPLNSLNPLQRDKITLGVAAPAAAGQKGRDASADTTATMRSEILVYSRARGAFAGISLQGAVLRPDKDANQNLYSRQVDVRELVEKGDLPIPEPARKFVQSVSQATSGK